MTARANNKFFILAISTFLPPCAMTCVCESVCFVFFWTDSQWSVALVLLTVRPSRSAFLQIKSVSALFARALVGEIIQRHHVPPAFFVLVSVALLQNNVEQSKAYLQSIHATAPLSTQTYTQSKHGAVCLSLPMVTQIALFRVCDTYSCVHNCTIYSWEGPGRQWSIWNVNVLPLCSIS